MSVEIAVTTTKPAVPVAATTTEQSSTVVIPSSARGLPGPQGPAGIILIAHGADPNVARPSTDGIILWRGSVQPANWDTTKDLWLRV